MKIKSFFGGASLALTVTGIVLVSIWFIPAILPELPSLYWRLTNDNPIAFGQWEVLVPHGWAAHTRNGVLHIYKYRRFYGERLFESIVIRLEDFAVWMDMDNPDVEQIRTAFEEDIRDYASHKGGKVPERRDFPVAGHLALCLEMDESQSDTGALEVICYVAETAVRFHYFGDPEHLGRFYEVLNYFELRNSRSTDADE